jgi:redox-sensitive bicupin YhaK (pirin superfamily)
MHVSIHSSQKRGLTQLGWLTSRHSFSFGEYFDPDRRNFGTLIVFNDDVIAGGRGFGSHPHADAEIVSIVLEGSLRHADSMGNAGVISAGEVQRMSAGSGIVHSEMNASTEEPGHFLQVWVLPSKEGIAPSYEQKRFDPADRKNKLQLIVSPDGRDGSLSMHQTAFFSLGSFDAGKKFAYKMRGGSSGLFAFLVHGGAKVDGKELKKGDSAEITSADEIVFETIAPCELVLIEVPMQASP